MGVVSNQFRIIISCNLLVCSCIIAFSWIEKLAVDFFSNDQAYGISDALAELRLAHFIGSIVGAIAVQFINRQFGVKRTIQLLGIPIILGFILSFLNHYTPIFFTISEFVSAIADGGLFVAIPTLINDMSNDKKRGSLLAINSQMKQYAYFVAFFFTISISHKLFSSVYYVILQVVVPVTGVTFLYLLRKSPDHLDDQNRKQTIGLTGSDKRNYIVPTSDAVLEKHENDTEMGMSTTVDESVKSSSKPHALKKFWTPQAKKAYLISFGSLILSNFTYKSFLWIFLFKSFESGVISWELSFFLHYGVAVVGELVFLFVVNSVNRKSLYISSSILCSTCFLLYGACLLFGFQLKWLLLVCSIYVSFFSSLGLRTIPFVVTYEIFPKEIRETSLAISLVVVLIVDFCAISVGTIAAALSFEQIVLILAFSVLCLMNALFGKFVIPETRGKSHQQIMNILNE